MDFVSTALVTVTQPSGFWESILNSFKGATGTYMLAVILLAVLVRIVFSLVDIINKRVTYKNSDIQAKMKPELDAIQKKYGHNQQIAQQKTSEIYKKYQFSLMGSCVPMLVAMALQLTVFLTLWNSLQSVSNYNIVKQYSDMKDIYANVLVLNEDAALQTKLSSLADDTYNLDTSIDFENNKLNVTIDYTDESIASEEFEFAYNTEYTNEDINILINKYTKSADPDATPSADYTDTGINAIIQTFAENVVELYYRDTQEGFMWIQNIYKAEAPTSPFFTESEIITYMTPYLQKEGLKGDDLTAAQELEKVLYASVVAGVDTKELGLNGYYILTIITVITAFLSTYLTNKLMRKKSQPNQPGGKMMYIIMPLVMGIFTFMYTSLFAIYIIIGQLVMIALTPLTTYVVRKWIELESKKKKDNDVIEVDYRRK